MILGFASPNSTAAPCSILRLRLARCPGRCTQAERPRNARHAPHTREGLAPRRGVCFEMRVQWSVGGNARVARKSVARYLRYLICEPIEVLRRFTGHLSYLGADPFCLWIARLVLDLRLPATKQERAAKGNSEKSLHRRDFCPRRFLLPITN